MSQKRIQQIERRIERIKTALLEIGPMRPGATVQALIFHWTNVVNRATLIFGAAGHRHKTSDTFRPAGTWLGPSTTAAATS